MTHQVIHGDSLDVLRQMTDNSIDAIVTDPPYGLSFMGKRWDYDVPSVELWAECLRVLKPGGHLLAFAGTRTQHRMAVRIEDAGFEIRDMIAWVYGSGFPKSLDVSKAIDRAAGAEREVVGPKVTGDGHIQNRKNGTNKYGTFKMAQDGIDMLTAPATDAARQWDGWGTALKPALEPITVARKPLVGTVAANVIQWGTGALNIDACRVGTTRGVPASLSQSKSSNTFGFGATAGHPRELDPNFGRWPANLIHDGSDEVVGLFPDRDGGCFPGRTAKAPKFNGTTFNGGNKYQGTVDAPPRQMGDSGSAARFFYCAKASRRERDAGLEDVRNHHATVKPIALMEYLIKLVLPPGGVVLDPFAGSGTTGCAAARLGVRSILIEREAEYVEIARRRVEYWAGELTPAAQ